MAEMKKPMTDIEMRLLKEKIIREYQLKNAKGKQFADRLFNNLKAFQPFGIIIGIIAVVLLVYIEGWLQLVHMLLFGIIWITLISTLIPLFAKQK